MSGITENLKKRITWIDTAKGIGIFFIVLGHVLRIGIIRQFIYSFHVPFFFLLTGLTYKKSNNLKKFLSNKAKTLLLPYCIFALISIIIYFFMSQYIDAGFEKTTDIGKNIFGLIYANPRNGLMKWNLPLWFLPSLFSTLLIVETIEQVFQKYNRNLSLKRLILVVVSFLISILTRALWIERKIMLPYFFESLFFLLGFVEIGILVTNQLKNDSFKEKVTRNPCYYLLISIALMILGTIVSWINGNTEVIAMVYGKYPILFILSSLLYSAGFILLSILISDKYKIHLVGRVSLSILLMHKFPILLFQFIIPFTRKALADPTSANGFIVSLLVSTITIAVCLIADRVLQLFLPEIVGRVRYPITNHDPSRPIN